MVIKCPNCERRFDLQRKAPETFRCPKCGYTAPFTNITNAEVPTDVVSGPSTTVEEKTRFLPELNSADIHDKTHVVQNLQKRAGALMQIMSGNHVVETIPIPNGPNHTLGRKSSDSKATIKIAPDITMSRVHAYLAVMAAPGSGAKYLLKPATRNNPLYVNNRPVEYGTATMLRSGDMITMGSTTIIFKM